MVQLTARHHIHNIRCGSTGSLILIWLLHELVHSKHNNICQFYIVLRLADGGPDAIEVIQSIWESAKLEGENLS
jgi:hypothetical protein